MTRPNIEKIAGVLVVAQRLLACATLTGLLIGGGLLYRSLDARQRNLEAVIATGFIDGTAASQRAIGEVKAEIHSQLTPVTTAATGTMLAASALLANASGAVGDLRAKVAPLDLNAQLAAVTVPAASAAASIAQLSAGVNRALVPAQGLLDISHQVARDHLVEKGNGKAWPTQATAIIGEVVPTLNSFRLSVDTVQKLVAEDGPPTALSVRVAMASGVKVSASLAGIAASADAWVKNLTAPETWKAKLEHWLEALVLLASHFI